MLSKVTTPEFLKRWIWGPDNSLLCGAACPLLDIQQYLWSLLVSTLHPHPTTSYDNQNCLQTLQMSSEVQDCPQLKTNHYCNFLPSFLLECCL